jgi:HEAT repeat protein
VSSQSPNITPSVIAAALDAPDAEERRQATALMSELPLDDALPLLLRALGDVDWRVRKEATFSARAFVPQPALIDAMIKVFEPGDNVGLRNAAVEVLASCGSASTGKLAASLARLDADGRKLAVQALGRTRDPVALDILERSLRDDDHNVRQGAVEAIAALGLIAPEAVQKLLVRCLEDSESFVKLTALEGLNAIGAMAPWERIEPLLDDPTLRTAALTAAALAESPKAALALTRTLRTARGGTFTQAMTALARLCEGPLLPMVAEAFAAEPPELGERLTRFAVDPRETPHHRATALLLAAVARAKGVVDAAVQALSEETFTEQAERALLLLGPAALPGLVARIAPDPGPDAPELVTADVRATLIEVAASIALSPSSSIEKPEVLLEALRLSAQEEERRTATSALFALSRLGTAEDLELAARLAASPIRPIAHAAEGALAALASRYHDAARGLADQLVLGSADGRPEDAFPAAVLLGALAASRSDAEAPRSTDLAFLARAATADDVRTRRAAIGAVAEMGGASSLDVLAFALADEERDVQLAAARALGFVGAGARRKGQPTGQGSTIATILDLVNRSRDPELVATAIRTLGEGMATLPVGTPEGSAHPAEALISALSPLARGAEGAVAIAAVEAIGRLPWGVPGRQAALVAAFDHPDGAVVKAAMLKLETGGTEGEELLRCLDHPSPDVRLLAAETLAGSDNPVLRERLAQRASVELDRDVRDALEGALSSIRWRGERGSHGS